jgi:CelD/BcsL family acetyltransferase involved in cellulose biosynthesis
MAPRNSLLDAVKRCADDHQEPTAARSAISRGDVASHASSTAANDSNGTRIITTIGDVEQLRSVWTSFEGHRDGDIDFYLEFIRSSSNTLRPHVIVFYRDGEPAALLAGRLDLNRIDHRLGYIRLPSVRSRALMFMGFRGEQTQANCTPIVESLLETLRTGDADYAQIPTIHDSGIYRAALQLPSFVCRDHLPELSQNYILRISGDFEQVYGQLSSNLREQIKRKKKKIQADFKGNAKFICYTQPDDLESVVPQIEEVARKSYQRGLAVGFNDNVAMRRRLAFCATRGWLRIFVAYLGGRPAGFSIGTVCNKTYTSDFLGYDPQYRDYSVGTVLQSALIEKCCEDGVHVIDFSAGYADYKKRFGNDSMTVARVYVFAPKAKGIYLNGVKTVTASLNKTAKYILASGGLLSKMKKTLRSRAWS